MAVIIFIDMSDVKNIPVSCFILVGVSECALTALCWLLGLSAFSMIDFTMGIKTREWVKSHSTKNWQGLEKPIV